LQRIVRYLGVDATEGWCDSVNECVFNNGECSQTCVDTYDSYYCTCRDGYQLAQNNDTCSGKSCQMPYTSVFVLHQFRQFRHFCIIAKCIPTPHLVAIIRLASETLLAATIDLKNVLIAFTLHMNKFIVLLFLWTVRSGVNGQL